MGNINVWLSYEPASSGDWIHSSSVESFARIASSNEVDRVCIHAAVKPAQFGGRKDGNLNGIDAARWIVSSSCRPRVVFLRSSIDRNEMIKLLTLRGLYQNIGPTTLHGIYTIVLHLRTGDKGG